jgi:hypothetical protein
LGVQRLRLIEDIVFQEGSESDRGALSAFRNHVEMSAGSHCVYIFSLADSQIPYPSQPGSVIYIGEAGRTVAPSGGRFTGHISKSLTIGNNYTLNRTVSVYYHGGHKLRLRIFRLDSCETAASRKAVERRLIAAHVARFGAQPMGQGTTGPSYTPKAISRLAITPEEDATIALVALPERTPNASQFKR